MHSLNINRRRFERFHLPAAYTAIHVRTLDQTSFTHSGHSYDISEGGVQFELDEPIAPGTAVAVQVDLPEALLAHSGDTRAADKNVLLYGNIVWLDDSEPGPVRMALVITRYDRPGDRERLIRVFAGGRLSRVAA